MSAENAPSPRRVLWPRVLIGAALAAGAVACVFWSVRRDALKITVRLDPPAVAPGAVGRLLLGVEPGLGAPEGAQVGGRPTATVTAPPEVVFDRPHDYFLTSREILSMPFKVAPNAAPGQRRIAVRIEAELTGAEDGFTRPAWTRAEVELTISSPAEVPKE